MNYRAWLYLSRDLHLMNVSDVCVLCKMWYSYWLSVSCSYFSGIMWKQSFCRLNLPYSTSWNVCPSMVDCRMYYTVVFKKKAAIEQRITVCNPHFLFPVNFHGILVLQKSCWYTCALQVAKTRFYVPSSRMTSCFSDILPFMFKRVKFSRVLCSHVFLEFWLPSYKMYRAIKWLVTIICSSYWHFSTKLLVFVSVLP